MRIREVKELLCLPTMVSNHDVLVNAMKLLSSFGGQDIVYRSKIVEKKLRRSPNSIVLQEIPVGNSRLDLAFVSSRMEIIEIKGPRDNLEKLNHQVFDYRQVASYVSVLAGGKNMEILKKDQASYHGIGVYGIGDRGGLVTVKRPQGRPQLLSREAILSFCNFEDLIDIGKKFHAGNRYADVEEAKRSLERSDMTPVELERYATRAIRNRSKNSLSKAAISRVDPRLYYWVYGKVSTKNQLERVTKWLGETL